MKPTAVVGAALRALGVEIPERVELLAAGWHGDHHVRVRGLAVRAVRLGQARRYEAPESCTAESVRRQIDVARAFRAAGLPIMELARGPVELDGYVAVAFAWAAGSPRAAPDAEHAHAIGSLLRDFHDAGRQLDTAGLPRHDIGAMARRSLTDLAHVAPDAFLRRAAEVTARLLVRRRCPIVTHGDLNLSNVLFGPLCVVDFDQIGAQDPLEELAWVIKWWSRGDRELASAVLDGYGTLDDTAALAPMLWASGCLNGNSVAKLVRARDRHDVAAQLLARADALANAVT